MAAEEGDVAYESYEPLFPCQNKKIQKSLDADTFKKHRDAVGQASSCLDTKQPRVYIHQHLKLKKLQDIESYRKQPRVYIHQHLKLKKLQLEEERLATIERDNRLLLERIAKIMRTKGSIDNDNLNREVKSCDFPNSLRSARGAKPVSCYDPSSRTTSHAEQNQSRASSASSTRIKSAYYSRCFILPPEPLTARKEQSQEKTKLDNINNSDSNDETTDKEASTSEEPPNESTKDAKRVKSDQQRRLLSARRETGPPSLTIERRQRELLRVTQENKHVLGRIMARKTASDYSRENWEPRWRQDEYYMAQLSRFQPVVKKKKSKKDDQEQEDNQSKEDAQSQNQQKQQQQKKSKKSAEATK